jgi:hypothetical protein
VTREHRYRPAAAIRPLLFWVGAKNVGGARIVWRHDGEALYDLKIAAWERVAQARYGARTYDKLVRVEFESRNRERGTTERFVLACGTEGHLAEVPAFVRYQPKWWFRVDGVLDEDETL